MTATLETPSALRGVNRHRIITFDSTEGKVGEIHLIRWSGEIVTGTDCQGRRVIASRAGLPIDGKYQYRVPESFVFATLRDKGWVLSPGCALIVGVEPADESPVQRISDFKRTMKGIVANSMYNGLEVGDKVIMSDGVGRIEIEHSDGLDFTGWIVGTDGDPSRWMVKG